ncbi:hypothetical protein Poli38472_001835 [Pythium oligandrum]|uniref:Uncharacterized protein n=1 Tax=Pythium oligandrum TaxID=41045 RepID=A0A8K1CUV7_PYTOL|nr:hypothetical protein Poli38472_001835 [Pythium oligandrum]|eukprot:TMW69679.1 hypothetical protein Poli38472_001835 [Pythium oligandrum]
MHDGGRFVTGVSSLSLQPCIIAGGIAKHQQFTINEVNDHMFYGGVGIHSVHKAALRLGYDGTDVNFQLCRDWGMSKWFNLEFVEDTITPVAPVIVPTSSTQVSLQDILQNQVQPLRHRQTWHRLKVRDVRM